MNENIPAPRQPDPSAGSSGMLRPAATGTAVATPMPDMAAAALELEEETFNPLHLWVYVVRYRWLIVAFLLTGLALGALATALMAPKYRARALLEIAPPTARVLNDLQITTESADIRSFRTALEKLRSRQMMRRVVQELGLTERQDFLFPKAGFSFSNLLDRLFGRLQAENPMKKLSQHERERLAIRRLQSGLSVKLLRNTRLIEVSYSSTSPEYARLIANQFANSFIASNLDQSSETSRLARQFIAEQLAEVKKKLEKAEKELVAYARQAGITLSDKEGSLIAANIRALNSALSEAIQERLKYERLVRMIKAGKAMELEEVINNEALQQRRAKIVELKAEYRQKLGVFKPGYPEMRQLKAQIDELRALLRRDVQGIANGIRLKYEVAVRKEQDLRQKLKELQARQAEYQDKNIRYTILKREVDSYRSQYKSLIDKYNQLGVASEARNKSASIVEYAITPDHPYSPSLLKNLTLALLLSGVAAAGAIYILELLNNTFQDPEQLERELRLPVFGILPAVPEEKLGEELADPRSPLSEAYRTLRTSLQFAGIDGAPRSLLVTSSEPREGKSTVARKLAEEFGALGMNVLLIDADMRKPMQHRLAGIPNSLGLSNLLTNTVPASQAGEDVEVMRNTPWPNVWLVTAGTLPPNPANLLASQKMGMFIEACCQRFDIVIIDAPPVIGLADALLLSRLAEATLLVVRARTVARKAVQNAAKRLSGAGGQVVGTAFNGFALDRVEYKYSYRYMNYGYLSYDYTYGEENGGKGRKHRKRRHKGDLTADADATERNVDFGHTLARLFRRHDSGGGQRSGEPDAGDGAGNGAAPQPPEHGRPDQPSA